jgi:predicted small lipoprotein YifL
LRKFRESSALNRQKILKTVLLLAALSGALALDGCGRRGPPVPLDANAAAAAKAAGPDETDVDPTANSQKPLPRGRDDNALKAGAPKGPTPFDFLL